MTKTLTEQWREGTLPAGYYYIIANTKARNQVIFYLPENTNTDGAVIKGEVVNGEDGGWVVEVLGPVPSYDEHKRLQKRLKIYEKAMERTDGLRKCLNQEGQIKRLQEQLKEAQNLIIYTANGHDHLFAQIKCEDYMHKYHLPKWGVK